LLSKDKRVDANAVTEQLYELGLKVFEDIQAACLSLLLVVLDSLKMEPQIFRQVESFVTDISVLELEHSAPAW
jgi:hypothetical protein